MNGRGVGGADGSEHDRVDGVALAPVGPHANAAGDERCLEHESSVE
jgi:hypothetical protein